MNETEHFEALATQFESLKNAPLCIPDLNAPAAQARGVQRLHGYRNYTDGTVGSFCGQAAIATLWDLYGFDPKYPGLTRVVQSQSTGRLHWHDNIIVGEISRRFPNDIIGMSPNRLCDGLRAGGLRASWGWGPQIELDHLTPYLVKGIPVSCVVHTMGWAGLNHPLGLHWVVVVGLTPTEVTFTNYPGRPPADFSPISLAGDRYRLFSMRRAQFDDAWRMTGLTRTHLVAGR